MEQNWDKVVSTLKIGRRILFHFQRRINVISTLIHKVEMLAGLYRKSTDALNPWSIGWDTDVVHSDKNVSLTLGRLPIVECATQLLIINAISRFSLSRTYSSKMNQTFCCDRYWHGSDLVIIFFRVYKKCPFMMPFFMCSYW